MSGLRGCGLFVAYMFVYVHGSLSTMCVKYSGVRAPAGSGSYNRNVCVMSLMSDPRLSPT